MKLMCWYDGVVIEASQFAPQCPYVMQRIHTLNYQPFNTRRHLALIREATESMFGFATLCRFSDAERIISKLLILSRVSPTLSVSVAMRIESSGKLSFEVELPSLSEGYCLRASRMIPAPIRMSLPDYCYQSSLTVAMDSMADSMAVSRGGDAALWVDTDGNIISRSWCPIFAVYHNNVYTPVEYETVEYVVVKEAIMRANLNLVVRSIPAESLTRMEELFMADTMCLRAFSSIKNHKLLTVATMRIANQMKLVK